MYNKGFELGLNAQIFNSKNFRWNMGLNLSTLENKVTALTSDVFVPSVFGVQNMTREGYSVGSIFAVPCKGVNPVNGQMVFINSLGREVQYNHIGSPKWTYVQTAQEIVDNKPLVGAPAIDNYKDGVMQGPSLPKIFGGFNNTFNYKKFDLTINFTFVQGNKLYNGTRATNSDQRYFNNAEFIKDRWTTPGQVTEIQKLVYGDNVSAGFSFTSTSKVEDGSYIKLKNIAFGYHLDTKNGFLSKTFESAYVYAQAGNLFTLRVCVKINDTF
jgi:TonB-dependent starch-binding outer membrane protein SusC